MCSLKCEICFTEICRSIDFSWLWNQHLFPVISENCFPIQIEKFNYKFLLILLLASHLMNGSFILTGNIVSDTKREGFPFVGINKLLTEKTTNSFSVWLFWWTFLAINIIGISVSDPLMKMKSFYLRIIYRNEKQKKNFQSLALNIIIKSINKKQNSNKKWEKFHTKKIVKYWVDIKLLFILNEEFLSKKSLQLIWKTLNLHLKSKYNQKIKNYYRIK